MISNGVHASVTCEWPELNEARIVVAAGTPGEKACPIGDVLDVESLHCIMFLVASETMELSQPLGFNKRETRAVFLLVFVADQDRMGKEALQARMSHVMTQFFAPRNIKYSGFVRAKSNASRRD